MLIFGLRSTSDDRQGWSMDSNPVNHPSPAKKMKCSFLDYVQLLIISQAGKWTRTPSATPLQLKNEMLIFGLRGTRGDWPGWLMDSNPLCHPSQAKKVKCSFSITFNFCLSAGLVDELKPHLPPFSSQKCKILSTSDDRKGWLMDSKPICHPSPAENVK